MEVDPEESAGGKARCGGSSIFSLKDTQEFFQLYKKALSQSVLNKI